MDDAQKPALDLEKELTCSICTDLLYQPLTLLDCLHTFCGACLKEWFKWQATAAENSPNPPAPGSPVFTCPSCRAPVRDTRHNATVATLLDMFLGANPEKDKPQAEKEEMRQKYKPGDQVLPKLKLPERTPEQRRMDAEDRRLMEEVRQMSLADAGVGSSRPPRSRRHREGSTPRDSRERHGRDPGRDGTARVARERSRRQIVEADPRSHAGENTRLQPHGNPRDEHRRRRSSEPRQHPRTLSEIRDREIEHQSSLRSLLSSSDDHVDTLDLEREIEDFARQIQEEGLLDGLDLENIDLVNDDELSRRITEAYRRRQRDRSRQERRRDRTASTPRHHDVAPLETRSNRSESRPNSRQGGAHASHARAASAGGNPDNRIRPSLASTPTHLAVHSDTEQRRRRRTTSGGRSSTTPLAATQSETRVATRSQTDLSVRTNGRDPSGRLPFGEGRSSSSPTVNTTNDGQGGAPAQRGDLSFSARANLASPTHAESSPLQPAESSSERPKRPRRPSSIVVLPNSWLPPSSSSRSGSPLPSPGHHRTRSQLYPEPSYSCSRCQKGHIEYELHYNCKVCAHGEWNICLDCYRSGRGCLHWFGFGYGALASWKRKREKGGEPLTEEPHRLYPQRYLPPRVIPGGADGRQTLTQHDPAKRLETGVFCASCLAPANDCYWQCDTCNDGEWGFCNTCVNQGRCCPHALLPLSHQPTQSPTPPASPRLQPITPRSPRPPQNATLASGSNVARFGSFAPLTFTTRCDLCQSPIPPTESRYHCFHCSSSIEQDTQAGDYDVCLSCYNSLVARRNISPDNGPGGWRRCQHGHRMVVIAFRDVKGSYRRYTVQGLIGGERLKDEPFSIPDHPGIGLEKWFWQKQEDTGPVKQIEWVVSRDVSASAPPATISGHQNPPYPPAGGYGATAVAMYGWHVPGGTEEGMLSFPKGAEILEVDNINEEWLWGTYMGEAGGVPVPHVRVLDNEDS